MFVDLFERYMPDPFVLAIGLTAITAVLALLIAPHGSPTVIVMEWYKGTFAILAFAFQMILILATGHALAHAPVVAAGLRRRPWSIGGSAWWSGRPWRGRWRGRSGWTSAGWSRRRIPGSRCGPAGCPAPSR